MAVGKYKKCFYSWQDALTWDGFTIHRNGVQDNLGGLAGFVPGNLNTHLVETLSSEMLSLNLWTYPQPEMLKTILSVEARPIIQ